MSSQQPPLRYLFADVAAAETNINLVVGRLLSPEQTGQQPPSGTNTSSAAVEWHRGLAGQQHAEEVQRHETGWNLQRARSALSRASTEAHSSSVTFPPLVTRDHKSCLCDNANHRSCSMRNASLAPSYPGNYAVPSPEWPGRQPHISPHAPLRPELPGPSCVGGACPRVRARLSHGAP